jgi:hypothetical protein
MGSVMSAKTGIHFARYALLLKMDACLRKHDVKNHFFRPLAFFGKFQDNKGAAGFL